MPPLDYPIKLCSLQLHWDDERVSQPYATRISSEFTFLKLKGTVPYCVLREACAHVYLLKLYLYASIREIQSREILSVSRLWAFSPCSSSTLLQSEHQMAEESFDSGVSSEHSQYTRDAKQQQQQICLNPVHQTHSVEELDGHYGPRLPQNLSCSQWQFNSEFHNRNSSRRRYLPPQGSFESSSDTDLLFASTSNLPTPQKSLQSLKEPNIRGSETSHTRDMSFNNPFDTPGSNRMHGFPINQGSSGNIREFNPRVVHFDREQTRGNERPALQSGLFSIEPSNSRVRLEEMQMYTPREEESTRYPYPRDYSTRDYARLPPMQHQPERTHPTGTPHPIGASVQSSTDRTNAYARDVNSLSTHPPFGASVSTHSTARQQASSILAALLTSQTRCTAPSLNENVPLQNITQRAGPSTSNLRRELLSARWSDSDMTAYGAHSLQQQQQQVQLRQQQQQQQMKLRQQQQQAAVAAAAAAAVAIAAIQGAPRSRSTVVTSPTGLTSTSVTFNPALARQTIRRSCYSSGDEEAFVTGVHGLGKDHEQQIHQFVSSPTIQSPPQPSDPSVRQQVLNQLAKLQSFSASADDYANYQTLEALLGRFHINPPPPAPPQPPPGKQTLNIYIWSFNFNGRQSTYTDKSNLLRVISL
ncbi:unnamed protein product [Dicrocoelium dendriticum]|nr:unnamed protein product [Dicrocoelium dendriticum]